MPRKKRKAQSSRGRSSAVGLLFVLGAAILLGVGVGSYLGNEMGKPTAVSQGPSPSPNHSATMAPAPRHPRSQESDRHATPRREVPRAETPKEPAQRAPDEKPKPESPSQPRVTVSEETKPPASPNQPAANKPKRRIAGMAGEIAHVASGTKIALTFDAGASPAPTPSILKTLAANGLHVTFFLTGKWAEQNPELVRQIRSEGHEIGNHTYSHPDLRKLSDSAILDQLKKTDDIIARITGRECDPLFRPPFGGRDKRVLRVVNEAGYTAIYWSLDSWDAFKKGITSKEITDRVMSRVQGGDIILTHCGSQPTADALPGLIRDLEGRGYQIVKVSELIRG